MSSINSKVPPPRLSAVDTPTDGQIPAYQASSGEFEWVDDTSNSPGGSDTQVQFNDGGSFGGDNGFTYTKATEKVKVGNASIVTSNAGKVSVIQESADTGAAMYLQKDEDGAGSGPNLVFYRNSASPANDDAIGRLGFNGEDSVGGERTYARITGEIEDVTSGANDGRIVIETVKAGTQTEQMQIDSAGIKFNDAYTFPTADGNANEVLTTDGAGALSFAAAGGTVVFPPFQVPNGATGDEKFIPTLPIVDGWGFTGTLSSQFDTPTHYPFYSGSYTELEEYAIYFTGSAATTSTTASVALYTLSTASDTGWEIGRPMSKVANSEVSFAADTAARVEVTPASTVTLDANTWYSIAFVGDQSFATYPTVNRAFGWDIYWGNPNYGGLKAAGETNYTLPASYSSSDTWSASTVVFSIPKLFWRGAN